MPYAPFQAFRTLTLCLLPLFFMHSCLPDEPKNPLLKGIGSYVFTPRAPLDQRPLSIHYFVPDQFHSGTPVLMLFHGNERNAMAYRDALIDKARAKQVLLIAPEFSETHYPGNNAYHLGGMFVDGEKSASSPLLPSSEWTFSLPDQIYSDVRAKNALDRGGYSAIGHSAGAQFLHRYLMFWPESEAKNSVISAAGWYNLPDTAWAFPHGLKYSPFSEVLIANFLRKEIHLQIGTNDNNPNSSSLRHDSLTDLQGLNRLTRARYYRQQIESACDQRALSMVLTYKELPGFDHSFEPAIEEAFDFLFP
ncbi:MAG: hypothetical protein ACO3GN_01430 [Bacteroidia bacterium]